jgi:hypothetical protein
MAQDLTVNIKTTSDVPQAMDRAKTATVGFSKQVDDIGRKFSSAFKDIALGFVAPLIIVNKIISSISDAFEKSKQMSKDALAFGSDASNKYVSEQESSVRRLINLRNEDNKNRGLGERGTREAYAEVLMNEGRDIFNQNRKTGQGFRPYKEGDIFKGFDQIAAEEMSKDPKVRAQIDALVQKMLPALEADKDKTPRSNYSSPQGVNAVVGMGNNAAMDAMTAQLEESRRQTMLLEQLANSGSYTPIDFTKYTGKSNSAPQYPKFN